MFSRMLGWESCSFDRYREACLAFGFNTESDPDLIRFQMELGAKFDFVACCKKGVLQGAACLDHGWLANDKTNPQRTRLQLMTPADAVYVPFRDDVKCIMPFRSKCLHPLNHGVLNSAFTRLSNRKICLTKSPLTGFSKKTVASREREARRLLEDGGYFRDFSDFAPDELLEIYFELLGDVLYYQGEPCAMQLNIMTPSRNGLFVDYINMGLNTEIKAHSLGTLLIWSNLKKAHEQALAHNLELYYSFGNPSAAYKERWCTQHSIGKLFYL